MARKYKKQRPVSSIYSFALTWLVLSILFPLYRIWALALVVAASFFVAYTVSSKRKKDSAEVINESSPVQPESTKKTYGPDIDPIIEEGNRALAEMGRIYMNVKDTAVKSKINELMRITDKITQDAIDDPSDIPQIKKFLNYYLPTTIKLLNAYDRMSSQGIEGDNLNKSMKNINDMLDDSIDAFRKMLDSLFANQALDIETDIAVMNQMLEREGLSGEKDFKI